jgi:hypothetical protein
MPTLTKPRKMERRQVPYDPAAMQEMPAWRDNLCWPGTPIQVAQDVRQGLTGYLELTADAPELDTRRLLMAAGPRIVGLLWRLLDYARSLQESDRAGIELVSSHPDFNYFKNGGTFPAHSAASFFPTQIVVPRRPLVRKLINIASWSPLWAIPGFFMFPTATAFSNNSELMHEYVGPSGARLTFRDPGHYLIEARARQRTENTIKSGEFKELAAHITGFFAATGRLEGIYLSRFNEAGRIDVETVLTAVQADLIQLRNIKLPETAWTGSAKYASRIVAHEIIRRGGEVIRFDHGGSTAMNGWAELDANASINGATRFVMATNSVAQLSRQGRPERFVTPVHRTEIVGGAGYPHLRLISRSERSKSPSRRRRVMYCPTFSRAHSANPGETIGEPIHTDFSLRISKALAELSPDFVVKPHPQSVPPNGRHHAEAVAKVSYERFEDVMGDVDVFVFDTINSTTFWEALCTDKLVILMDLGTISIGERILPMLKRRCQVLVAAYDDAGKPQIDLEALQDAVMADIRHADPTEFRQLLAHEG